MTVRVWSSRALEFACHSKACAPPPAGVGGSKPGNTSVVAVDRHRKVAASDDHPEAPGARNLAAVRGYRGETGLEPERRVPRAGETVDLYRDLGRGREHRRGYPDHDAFSVRLASGKDGNSTALVTASTVGVVLSNGRPSWAMAAKRKAEGEGKRGVHAFVRGEVERYVSPAVGAAMVKRPGWEKVTYYPGTQDFFRPSDRARWTGADKVVLVKGEFFAKNARFDTSSPTPISPIEKRMGLTASASSDDDNLYPQSGSHHVSNGRWFRSDGEFGFNPRQPRDKDGKWTVTPGTVHDVPAARSAKAKYMADQGLSPDTRDYSGVTAPADFRRKVAAKYAEMPLDDPAAHKAYGALAAKVQEQYDYLTKTLGIKVEVTTTDPYPDINAMLADVGQGRLKVLATASTGSHPYFTDKQNDMFRAVHDYFGHAATGREFDRHGERATYLSHARTFGSDKDAIRALFTETEAQNAYVVTNQEFGPQKVALYPDTDVFFGLA